MSSMRKFFVLVLSCMILDCFGALTVDQLLKVVKAAADKKPEKNNSGNNSVEIVRIKMDDDGQVGYISNSSHTSEKQSQTEDLLKAVSKILTDYDSNPSHINEKRSHHRNEKQSQTKDPLKAASKIPLLKRSGIFPRERIKSIDISPDGKKIAYLVEKGKRRYIKIIPSQDPNLMSQTIEEDYPIVNFSFIGTNLLYTHFDKENTLKVKVQISLSKKKQLELPENLKSIRLFKNAKACLAECYDGERYSLHQINISNFFCREIKELSGPVNVLFDKDLTPFLIMKKDDDVLNVYVDSKKNGKDFVGEDEVDLGFEEQMQELDHIENPSLSRYFSVDNEKNCYKISIKKPKKLLVIEKINPFERKKKEIYKLKGVSYLSQCKINMGPTGKPAFITVNSRRYQHYGCDQSTKVHLKAIDKRFNSWYRINTTADGKIWLLCVVNDRSLDKFYLYDMRTGKFKIISNINNSKNSYADKSLDNSVKKSYLRPMDCYFWPQPGNEYIQWFLTRGVNSTSKSPLILMINGQYKWGYIPMVQVLANRGYNVLCLNYRRDDIQPGDSIDDLENAVNKATSDMELAINWAVKNNIAQEGNIVLLAKKHSVLPAIQMFLKKQEIFSGCIAINPSENDINLINSLSLEEISKPAVFIGRFNNSEAISSLIEQIPADFSSVISSNELMNQKLITGIIEVFLAEKFNNSRVESISRSDINSLDIKQDGLNIITSTDNSRTSDVDDEWEEDLANRYMSIP